MADTANWLGYEFEVHDAYDVSYDWNAVGGLYVFAGKGRFPGGALGWKALYVGQTQDFSDRLPNHEKWRAAEKLGATHIHAMVEESAVRRLEIEEILVGFYEPPLNKT